MTVFATVPSIRDWSGWRQTARIRPSDSRTETAPSFSGWMETDGKDGCRLSSLSAHNKDYKKIISITIVTVMQDLWASAPLVLATNRHGSRKSSNQFDLWRTESCQDFWLKPHHFAPKLQTKISMRVLVRSARMFFYHVANFMRYKIKKYSSQSDKNSLTHFRSKILVREPVCDEPEEIRKSRIEPRTESMLGSIRHEPVRFVANTNVIYCVQRMQRCTSRARRWVE
jgi:hypothetical protein